MEKGKKEARVGLNSEKNIVVIINCDKRFKNLLKECLERLGLCVNGEIKALRSSSGKIDILLETSNSKIGVSVKTSTGTSFHHLDRRKLDDWKKLLNMPDDVYEIMKEAILRVAKNSNSKFILEKDRPKIKDFFVKNLRKMLEEIFTGNDKKLKLLMINVINYKENKKVVYIFKMDDVIDFIYSNAISNIGFTEKGIIKLGNFITVQRKGGNGKRVTEHKKTDWDHPGNQLQFKFSPLEFVKYVKNSKVIKYCEISC
ncbi:MAG: hypothetical protein QXF05_04580 [Thermofilaceae archaeon]